MQANDNDINLSLKRRGKGSTTIKTDNLIVKEVLTNLITNSLKYTPAKGKVEVIVTPQPSHILICVSDTGWGIPKYAQDQIFSKFFRAHNIVKRETSGTGLGLYLVKGLLESLDGTIWFTSKEGEGTKFYFTLPRTKRTANTNSDSLVHPKSNPM